MFDIFISYRREGGYDMARILYDRFKLMGLHPFLDLKELGAGHFDENLFRNIEGSSNFLLILPQNALDRCFNEKDWLKLEIEHAIKYNKNIIPVFAENFKWPEELPASLKDLRRYNGVTWSQEYNDAAFSSIVNKLKNVKINEPTVETVKRENGERTENTYFYFEDEKEKRRLRIQQNLMKRFDCDTYKKVLDSYDELYVLDIGSNNGDFIMDRIGKSEKVKLLVGLEYDAESVKTANEKYGENGRIAFFEQNVEDVDLGDRLSAILDNMRAEQFNVINISMIILHMKTPYRLLKSLRKFLARGGTVVIKDIDDGFNIAYPDEGGDFERVVGICKANETSGYRHSGRQIYTLLRHAGYRDVCLEKQGLSTIGMDYDERSALFDTYFSFILEDLKIMLDRYPNDKQIQNDYKWYLNIYEDLEERFQDDAFFFNLGFVMFTAKK